MAAAATIKPVKTLLVEDPVTLFVAGFFLLQKNKILILHA
jgi:hypothetical protein